MAETQPRTYYTGNGTRYARAQQHIEETTENIFTERLWWRRGVFALLALCAFLGVVIWSLAQRPTREPVYLKVNAEGQLQILGWDAYQPEAEQIKVELFRWLRCVRGLPTDEAILDYCWQMVPRFLLERTQALAVVKDYYKVLNPKSLLFHKKIEITDLKGRREPDGRWRLEWTEDVYGFRQKQGIGTKESSERMSAVLTITRQKPTTRKDVELRGEVVNPLGLYLTSLAWGD
jgi:type IV secretory pathway TrbF-like protein